MKWRATRGGSPVGGWGRPAADLSREGDRPRRRRPMGGADAGQAAKILVGGGDRLGRGPGLGRRYAGIRHQKFYARRRCAVVFHQRDRRLGGCRRFQPGPARRGACACARGASRKRPAPGCAYERPPSRRARGRPPRRPPRRLASARAWPLAPSGRDTCSWPVASNNPGARARRVAAHGERQRATRCHRPPLGSGREERARRQKQRSRPWQGGRAACRGPAILAQGIARP